MRTLFVHERLGPYGGAEANISLTANELKRRGHTIGLLHGPHRGKTEAEWKELFSTRYPLGHKTDRATVQAALWDFQPDVIYLHKSSDLEVLQGLAASGTPVIRMIHDHDLYCMRGCKYFYFTRKICRRPLSTFCIFPCGGVLKKTGGFRFRWVSYLAKKKETHTDWCYASLDEVKANFKKARLGKSNVVFVEGMAKKGNRYLFYYGAADKYIGVAQASVSP